MTGRRSHGRLSALNGVVHQGIFTHVIVRSRAGDRGPWPETVAVLAGGTTTVAPRARAVS